MRSCPYCERTLSTLHHTGQRERVHLYCPSCGAHGYGAPNAVRWRSRREWSAWIEGTDEPEQSEAA